MSLPTALVMKRRPGRFAKTCCVDRWTRSSQPAAAAKAGTAIQVVASVATAKTTRFMLISGPFVEFSCAPRSSGLTQTRPPRGPIGFGGIKGVRIRGAVDRPNTSVPCARSCGSRGRTARARSHRLRGSFASRRPRAGPPCRHAFDAGERRRRWLRGSPLRGRVPIFRVALIHPRTGKQGGRALHILQWSGRCGRPYAAHQAEAGLRGDGLHDPRQGRVHEPRPVREGPRRALHHPGRHAARHAAARRHGGGRHRRQHRHRANRDRQRAGLPHASSSFPRPRARRRRTLCACWAPSSSRCRLVPYKDPNNYVHYSQRLARGARQDRAERRHLGQPVGQHRQPPRAHRDHGRGDLGRHRRQGRRLRVRGGLGRHAGRRLRRPQGQAQGHPDRARRRAGRGALQLLHDRRAASPRAPRSPRASARAASPRTSRAPWSTTPT